MAEAERRILLSLVTFGEDFMRPDPFCPQDYARVLPSLGCICNPITLARVRRQAEAA